MSTEKTEEKDNWRDIAIHFAVGTMRELGNNMMRSIQEKIDRVVVVVMRKLFSGVLLLVGLVFLLVGLAQFIGEILGEAYALGYVLVGAMSIMAAMTVAIAKGERI